LHIILSIFFIFSQSSIQATDRVLLDAGKDVRIYIHHHTGESRVVISGMLSIGLSLTMKQILTPLRNA